MMRNATSFDALLVSLHDSLARARDTARPGGEPEWMQRLRRQSVGSVAVGEGDGIVTRLAIAEALHGPPPGITELSLSFDCVLYESPHGLRLRLGPRRFWRRHPPQRVEIRLHGDEPIVMDVLLDGQLLRCCVGRPKQQETVNETHA